MKQLEIPYNYDKNLIDFLYYFSPSGDVAHCIYFPPFWEDYKSAKYYYEETKGGNDMKDHLTMTRDTYIDHINYINERFPGKAMLLLQRPTELIDEALLKEFYMDKFHITKYCVGSLEQAKVIKRLMPEAEITSSIAMRLETDKLSPEELEEYSKYIEYVVLWFPFNRDLIRVQNLPKNFKYVLLANCGCSIRCDGLHHWFASAEEEKTLYCPKMTSELNSYRDSIFIRPVDLPIWNDCIDVYKLQGREQKTEQLIPQIVAYSFDYLDEYFCPRYRSFDVDCYIKTDNPNYYCDQSETVANNPKYAPGSKFYELSKELGLSTGFMFIKD